MRKLFGQIGKGWIRLHIVLGVIVPSVYGVTLIIIGPTGDIETVVCFMLSVPLIYWIIVLLVQWIVDGFRSSRRNNPSFNDKNIVNENDSEVNNKIPDNYEQEPTSFEITNLDKGTYPVENEREKTSSIVSEKNKYPRALRLIINFIIYISLFLPSYFIFFAVVLFSMLGITGDKGIAGRQSPLLATLLAFIVAGYFGRMIIKKLDLRAKRKVKQVSEK